MFHSYVSLPEGNYSHMKQHIQNICTVHGWWVALQLYQVNIAGLRLDPSENQPSIYLQPRIPVIPLHCGRKRGSTNNPVDRFVYDTVWYDINIPVTLGRWSTFWNLQNLLQFLRTNCRNHPSHTIRIAILPDSQVALWFRNHTCWAALYSVEWLSKYWWEFQGTPWRAYGSQFWILGVVPTDLKYRSVCPSKHGSCSRW